jgi:hypothetical protein
MFLLIRAAGAEKARLAFALPAADIGAGGWRWASHSPTGSGPEGSSPNERGSGRSSASHPLLDVARIERSEIREERELFTAPMGFASLNPGYYFAQ